VEEEKRERSVGRYGPAGRPDAHLFLLLVDLSVFFFRCGLLRWWYGLRICALGPWLRAQLAFLGALAVRLRGSAFSR